MTKMGVVFAIAGSVLLAIGFVWGWVIGFTDSELPVLLLTLAGGALLLFIGSRILASNKPTKVEWTPTAPNMPATPQAVVLPPAAPAHELLSAPAVSVSAVTPALTPDPVLAELPTVIQDATVAVPRRRGDALWTLQLPDGATTLVREQVLLGRAPQPSTEHPRAELVVIDDPSLSKSHAVLRLVDGTLQVLDLDSANGTVLVVDDVDHPCAPGLWMTIPDGATLELGTAELLCWSSSSRGNTS